MPPGTFYEKHDLSNFKTWFVPLGPFYEETILNDFKNQFCRLAYFMRNCLRLPFEAARPVLGMFLDVYDLHGILDDSRYRMSHRWWIDRRSFWPDCHGIS